VVSATDRHARADLRLGDAEDPDEFVFEVLQGAKRRPPVRKKAVAPVRGDDDDDE